MTRIVLPDDIFAEFQEYERRLGRLEAAQRPEAIRYIGQSGQPAFAGTWVNFDAGISFATDPPSGRPAGFYRHNGHVYLVGVIKSGVSGTAAFQLPVGYRPFVAAGNGRYVNGHASGGAAQIGLLADGSVVPANVTGTAVATYVFLDGIVFRHA